jgi:high frequency lysogenization protein
VTTSLRDQCIAFAGVCQSAALVHRTAHGLATSSREIEPLITSIFATEPRTIDDVYGSVNQLRSGVAAANEMLSKPSPDLVPALKYVMALLDIETRLRGRAELSQALRNGIDELRASSTDRSDSLFAPLSALYQRTISTLDRRVHVSGSPEFLQRNEVAAKIRTLLLAGVRSAWLWHQSGGRRWHLILRRSTIRNMLTTLARPNDIH